MLAIETISRPGLKIVLELRKLEGMLLKTSNITVIPLESIQNCQDGPRQAREQQLISIANTIIQ